MGKWYNHSIELIKGNSVVTVGVNGRPLLHKGTGRELFLRNILSRCTSDISIVAAVPGDTEALQGEFPAVRFYSAGERISGRVWDRKFTDFLPVSTDIVFQPVFRIPKLSASQRLILSIHDLHSSGHPDFRTLFTGRFPSRLIASGMIRDAVVPRQDLLKAWRVVAISGSIAVKISGKFGFPEEAIEVIANGICSDYFQPDPVSALDVGLHPLGLSRGSYLLYVGGMVSGKNVGRLVTAYRALSPRLRQRYPLVLVGRGYWRKRLERLGIPGVIFLDYLSRRTLKALYQGAAGAVYPSISAGSGLPFYEAALLGAPVAASTGFASGSVSAAFCRMFDPFSICSIRDALQDMLLRPGRWRMSAADKECVRTDFSWSATAERYMQLFRQGGRNGGMQEAGQSFQV